MNKNPRASTPKRASRTVLLLNAHTKLPKNHLLVPTCAMSRACPHTYLCTKSTHVRCPCHGTPVSCTSACAKIKCFAHKVAEKPLTCDTFAKMHVHTCVHTHTHTHMYTLLNHEMWTIHVSYERMFCVQVHLIAQHFAQVCRWPPPCPILGLKRGANVYTNMSTNVLAVFLRKCGDLQIATCHTFVHWLARGQRPHPDGGQRRRRTLEWVDSTFAHKHARAHAN